MPDPSENAAAAPSDANAFRLSGDENRQPARRRARKPPSVQVDEDVIRQLAEHHQRLDGYLKGYLTFLNLRIACEAIQDALEDTGRQANKLRFLQDLRQEFTQIQLLFVVRDIWRVDFEENLTLFETALTSARDTLNAPGGPFSAAGEDLAMTIEKIRPHVGRMIMEALSIEPRCQARCEDEVEELGRHVKEVFRKLESRPSSQVLALNQPSSSAPLPAREDVGSDRDSSQSFKVINPLEAAETREDANNGQ
jgi:hypothetical protein